MVTECSLVDWAQSDQMILAAKLVVELATVLCHKMADKVSQLHVCGG